MEQVLAKDDIEVGRYYYLRTKNHPTDLPEISQAHADSEGHKYFNNRIWAEDDNPQAFIQWDIFGPVDIPVELVL